MSNTWPWNTEGLTLANLKDVNLTGLQEGQTLILSGTIFVPGTPSGVGTPGKDGRDIELQKGTAYIQWRYVGELAWTNLVPLTELHGTDGTNGTNGYTPIKGVDYNDGAPGTPGTNGVTPVKGIDYFDGAKGDTGPSVNDISYYRKTGTTTYEAWFTSPRAGTALAGAALVAGRMYAMPFISPKAITLDQIGVYVSTLSTTTARLGIYSDGGNCYPGSRLLDAGTIDVTGTGAKKIAINQALESGKLYWLVIVCAATPAIYCIPVAAVISILGVSNALGTAQNAGLYVTQAYGALPATFPSSPTLITAAPIPAIFVRLSA